MSGEFKIKKERLEMGTGRWKMSRKMERWAKRFHIEKDDAITQR
jgi:hypothetical protein